MLPRARAHRLLLTAALLTVALTTAVLATLTAYSGALGDASLRHALADPPTAGEAALVVKAEVPADRRAAADDAVRAGARRTFDGLPVTVRTLVRSGPYALPRSLHPAGRTATAEAAAENGGADSSADDGKGSGAHGGEDDGKGSGAHGGEDGTGGDNPDLTFFAALDRGQIRFTSGRAPSTPAATGTATGAVEAAFPEAVARRLRLAPGDRFTVTDRLDGPPVRVRVTGLYRPTHPDAPYWRLDDLGGRGVSTLSFTTYGPLVTAPGAFTSGRVGTGTTAWLATADYSALRAGDLDRLRDAAGAGPRALRHAPALNGSTAVSTSLPAVLDRVERALLVARSTLLIVALQLVLLAGYALLLVAGLLNAERAAETRLLRARGASRGRVAALAATEALLLALPAALCAPLLAGPLTALLSGLGPPARIGLRPDISVAEPGVWLVAGAAALGCAFAVTGPALTTASDEPAGRARALPAPVRAGADLGLLAVAGVAYWQLDRRAGGAVSGDGAGGLGIDPLLVAAPALALLAGTVLTLRLLPPVARLAERRAAAGRGLSAALAGWQFSRRPGRGAGPVLLLVLAVALGLLGIGQAASWSRSQDDQADFRAGAPVRLSLTGEGTLGESGAFAALPGVRDAAPAVRTTVPLSGDRTATVLALDTAHAAGTVLLRPDLTPDGTPLTGLAPKPSAASTAGTRLPKDATALRVMLRLRSDPPPDDDADPTADVRATVTDRYGVPYPSTAALPADGRPHEVTLDLSGAAGPLTLTALELTVPQPVATARRQTFTVERLTAVTADGTTSRLRPATAWTATSRTDGTGTAADARDRPAPPRVRRTSDGVVSVRYGTGFVPRRLTWVSSTLTVRLRAGGATVPEATGVATDRFLRAAGARRGERVDVQFAGATVPVRIVGTTKALPTTGAADTGTSDTGTSDTGTSDTGASTADASASGTSAAGRGEETDGGALLVDLRAVNDVLRTRYGQSAPPTEWWLRPDRGATARVAAALRERPELTPSQVVVRDEIAARLRDDPFGVGPQTAFAAAAVVAAALAAVGFAVSTAGALRERAGEFAVLRALGAPRRQLARLVAVEQGLLVALGLLVGTALGTVLTRAVVPLIVMTSGATRPVPDVLVRIPVPRAVLLLAVVAAVPLALTVHLSLRRRPHPAAALRRPGGD
ncbi:FtsX-like permease family protein [Streptomyces sp. B3I7]|uniref:FtsX-like permease family protein n=1 Tax=Streptomyces sp. B3I7 TaxID=3042269 RepID=UPI0027D7A03E|nr:FtsX-like permease family protein [Streptomyces sp. B3I7]